MKKRMPAAIIALLILSLALTSCQLFRKSSAEMAEPVPLPDYSPQIQIAKQISEELKQTVPMPDTLRAYDHYIYATTTPNPRDGFTTSYIFNVEVSEYFKHYQTRIDINLKSASGKFAKGIDFSLFKTEGQFIWNALKTSHGITDESIDAVLKALVEKSTSSEKPANRFSGYEYVPKDMPGFEFSYKPDLSGNEQSLEICIINQIPDDKATQETALDYLADVVIGGVIAQGVPMDYIKSSFYYAKADRSDDAIYETSMSHRFKDDFKTYKKYSRRYEFDLSAGNANDPNAVPLDEKEQQEFKPEFFDDKLVYNGKKDIVSFTKPVTVQEFISEARNWMNHPNFSPKVKTQMDTYIDNRQLEIPTSENGFVTTEESKDGLKSTFYQLVNYGFSFSFHIETDEKPSDSIVDDADSPSLIDELLGANKKQQTGLPNLPAPTVVDNESPLPSFSLLEDPNPSYEIPDFTLDPNGQYGFTLPY